MRYDEKERFFLVLGLLIAGQISFARAAEMTELSRDILSFLVDSLGIEYDFLSEGDFQEERDSIERLVQELKK
jgi:predicted HTH domain antitoxin